MSKVKEQLFYFVQHFLGSGILTIHFVDHQDHWQVEGQRLRQHISRLGQWAFRGVDQEQDAVYQR